MLNSIFNNYNFKQLHDIIKKLNLEILGETIIVEEKKYHVNDWMNVNAKLKNNLKLKILTLEDAEKIWITFYLKQGSINIEQIAFIMLKDNNSFNNNVIWHDYFIKNNDTVKTVNATYSFHNDFYISGVEKIRKVNFKDIAKYVGKDNLANLTVNIDNSKNTKILDIEDKNIVEEPNIEVIAFKNQAKDIKVLVKK